MPVMIPALERGFAFVGAALFVLCKKVDVVLLERSLQLVPIKIPAQFFFLPASAPSENKIVAPIKIRVTTQRPETPVLAGRDVS